MIPAYIIKEIEHWIDHKCYGEIRITFQGGKIQRWTSSLSKLPPSSSGTAKNPGEQNEIAPQGTKLEV